MEQDNMQYSLQARLAVVVKRKNKHLATRRYLLSLAEDEGELFSRQQYLESAASHLRKANSLTKYIRILRRKK